MDNPPIKSSSLTGSPQHIQHSPTLSTSMPLDQRPSYLHNKSQNMDAPATPPVGAAEIPEDSDDDGSDSSELEEGEINENDLPPIPTVTKPVPLHAGPARHFKREPPLHRPFHPSQRDLSYANEPNFEQSQGQYRNIQTPPYHSTPRR